MICSFKEILSLERNFFLMMDLALVSWVPCSESLEIQFHAKFLKLRLAILVLNFKM